MRWSHLFIPTLREAPAEAEAPSHRLLVRAGYIRPVAAGIYSYLFLAQRSFLKIIRIVREEMDAIGAQEMLLPALHPAELWQESGRWELMGDNMFRLKDRFGRELCLGMTHEEVMTAIARGELRSYKQLPQIWYQIQTKFRDEPRPKSGLLRVRQFLMKDSYSFDLDPAGLDVSYEKHRRAYCRIFDRCGLRYIVVEAHSGAMGGSQSHEFMVPAEAGEDWVVVCSGCGYSANLEKAVSRPSPPVVADPDGDLAPEEFHTPGRKTIAEVAEFTGLPPSSQIKSLVMMVDGEPVLALVRGDHTLSETKFAEAVGGTEVRPAHGGEIRGWFGADAGSLGPVGVRGIRIMADAALRGRRNMICGANKDDYHLRNVTPDEDFTAEYHDLRQVEDGDACLRCGGPLERKKAVEVGHIFKLGYKYSESMGLRVLDASGKEVTPIMGSYGIGIERILCAAVELYHDEDGMALPVPIAPFAVVVTPVNASDERQRSAAEAIYGRCLELGLDALLDDRDERPGVKFKDADLIGIPYRITVGKKLAQGRVEVLERRTRQSWEMAEVEAASWVAAKVAAALGDGR
ncbi:MAG: proline--tRNA ligase [Bryobacterales bacterium]|nr:proline--tRNA ligase [Bryobacteraceae bacterium]MDW8354369.1 proline--tRNA ligase [Bryobacterales bacterium]